jgi:hypothetical protein
VEVRHKSRGKNSSDDTLRQEMRKLVDLNTEVGRIVLISGKWVALLSGEDSLMILVSGEDILMSTFQNILMALLPMWIYLYSWPSFLKRISS